MDEPAIIGPASLGTIRGYYFTSEKHALLNLENSRLKISEVLAVNDPFEFMGLNVQDREIRRAVQKAKATMAERSGLICFSARWQTPLMWSHYADRHRGICLAFDLPRTFAHRVTYTKARARISKADILGDRVSPERALQIISCKAHYWSYEKEIRLFCSTTERDVEGKAFRKFDDDLKLRGVIVGHNCTVTRSRLREALGVAHADTPRFKARIAFGSFKVIRNKDQARWV